MDVLILLAVFGVWLFFFRCDHKWRYLRTVRTFKNDYAVRPLRVEKVYQCKKCLKIRREKV